MLPTAMNYLRLKSLVLVLFTLPCAIRAEVHYLNITIKQQQQQSPSVVVAANQGDRHPGDEHMAMLVKQHHVDFQRQADAIFRHFYNTTSGPAETRREVAWQPRRGRHNRKENTREYSGKDRWMEDGNKGYYLMAGEAAQGGSSSSTAGGGHASIYLHPSSVREVELVDVAVGTPPQKFQVRIDEHSSCLYLIGSNALYTSAQSPPPQQQQQEQQEETTTTPPDNYEYDATAIYDEFKDNDSATTTTTESTTTAAAAAGGNVVNDRSTFKADASSTYRADAGAEFPSSSSSYLDGSVGSDIVRLGGGQQQLSARLPIQLASRVANAVREQGLEEDGVLGISTSEGPCGGGNTSTSVMGRLAAQLDEPFITRHRYRNRYSSSNTAVGQLVIGSRAPELCDHNGWVPIANRSATAGESFYSRADVVAAMFDVVAISAEAVGGDGCHPRFESNFRSMLVVDDYMMVVSIQLGELFIRATGARWNASIACYEVPSVEQLYKANPITLHLAGGGTLELFPQDYVYQTGYGALCLIVNPYFDQNKMDLSYLSLGQLFLNNVCVAENIHTGERWLTRSVQQHLSWLE